MFRMNEWGKKIIGTALSAVMVISAVPAMASFASTNENGYYRLDNHYNYSDAISELSDRYIEVINYYYSNESILPDDFKADCEDTFNNVSIAMRDPSVTFERLDAALNQIENINTAVEYYVTSYEEEKNIAVSELYDLIDEMEDFKTVFGDLIPEDAAINFDAALDLAECTYVDSDNLTIEQINSVTSSVNAVYNATIDAVDNAISQIPDSIDTDTNVPSVVDETHVAVTETTSSVNEAASNEAPVVASSVVPAHATQVLGATRGKDALAENIVNSLYSNVLNRTADNGGKTMWVNLILSRGGNLGMVVTGFMNSEEFNARNLTDSEFVAVLYNAAFNRAPSAGEAALWTDALSDGTSRLEVISQIVNSSEFENNCNRLGL